MGWTPYEYYTSTPYEFFCACEGYFDKLDDQSAMFRTLAVVVNRSMGGDANMNSIWPLHGDEKVKPAEKWTEDQLTEMVKNANKQFAQIPVKNGRIK